MGNTRSLIIGAALLILTLLYLAMDSFPSEIEETPISDEKILSSPSPNPAHQVPQPANQVERKLAQETSSGLSRPISTINLRPSNWALPEREELQELDITELKDTWKIWITKEATYPTNNTETASEIRPGNFHIIDNQDNTVALHDFSTHQPVVLFNERLKTVGILTGNFAIRLRDATHWEDLQEELGLKLVHSIPNTNLFYATSISNRFNISSLFEMIQSHPLVESTQYEVVSRNYAKN